ncbi:hypothetical protein [Haloplasma contractile]|uniref:Integral membrane protein n=1 Tax=Haloplasma contractile SSD-17B TaxID=1033810 RepID=U2E0B1_9MOLU|nr:hypothetical protein [Haloplasma contractile]ERJ13862.1 integral membrane protein [Haloplasma contractile SSD-17B]
MWTYVLNKQKERTYILINSLAFMFFSFLYFLLDDFNGGYLEMKVNHGLYLPIINVMLNIYMAAISAFMIGLSSAFYRQSGKEGKGSTFGGVSVLFGIFTYGCTSCVISFFAAVGITFSVAALPLAGLPYKLVSVLLVSLGFVWLKHEIKNPKCKIKKES